MAAQSTAPFGHVVGGGGQALQLTVPPHPSPSTPQALPPHTTDAGSGRQHTLLWHVSPDEQPPQVSVLLQPSDMEVLHALVLAHVTGWQAVTLTTTSVVR